MRRRILVGAFQKVGEGDGIATDALDGHDGVIEQPQLRTGYPSGAQLGRALSLVRLVLDPRVGAFGDEGRRVGMLGAELGVRRKVGGLLDRQALRIVEEKVERTSSQ